MSIPEGKLYLATNGEEAIDLILNKFRDELVNSGLFPLHRTWHEFEFVGGVRVKGWSTKTEEVKFSVGDPIGEVVPVPDAELVEDRVDAHLAPAPPSLLRETLPNIDCPNKCGHAPFHSKESLRGHLNRWCKADSSAIHKIDAALAGAVEVLTSPANVLPGEPKTDVAPVNCSECGAIVADPENAPHGPLGITCGSECLGVALGR